MAFSAELLCKCWFLAGPTACGKTAVSLCLAPQIGAEIVALDSMTLYRGMDIGTAKPTSHELSQVRHHLIDVLEPETEFSLADYLREAELTCHDIVARGLTPLFVGGAGLYLRGLLRGVFEGPPADWVVRQRLEERARFDGPQSLWDQLLLVDPISAKRLHVNDQRRIIRALEVFELLGQPLSSLQQQAARPKNEQPQHVFWISPLRNWLYQRIDERVEQMFADGLVEEVIRLMARPEGMSHTARQALGYKEVIDWLLSEEDGGTHAEKGQSDYAPSAGAVSRLIQTRTRQFAKRQHTWFRNLEECRPILTTGTERPSDIADAIVSAIPSVER